MPSSLLKNEGFLAGAAKGIDKELPRRRRKRREDPYESLRDGYIAEYQKYKPSAALQDAVDYAEKRIEELKAKEREKRPMQKSKGGGVKKPAMAYGGMANKKKHMYTAGGSVKDYRPMQSLKKKY
jgi:hypothetical protein